MPAIKAIEVAGPVLLGCMTQGAINYKGYTVAYMFMHAFGTITLE